MTTPLSILIVDDVESIRTIAQDILTREGYDVAAAGTGRQAATLLKSRRFDVVLTDIIMPEGDGFELIMSLRKDFPATKIVAITGGGTSFGADYCAKSARLLGAHVVLAKPFKANALLAAVAEAARAAK